MLFGKDTSQLRIVIHEANDFHCLLQTNETHDLCRSRVEIQGSYDLSLGGVRGNKSISHN